jgi:hypothetical protein
LKSIKHNRLGNWRITIIEDDDKHLNIYITTVDEQDVIQIYTGQGDGIGEQLALRFTTPQIELEAE